MLSIKSWMTGYNKLKKHRFNLMLFTKEETVLASLLHFISICNVV